MSDFAVLEERGAPFAETGEHLYLRVRKCGQNTRWVAQQLAAFAGLPYKAVSYAGLKDRHAVTEQWFSLHLPGQAGPDWNAFALPDVTVVAARRHDRKLRQGFLSYNRFSIVLRNLSAVDAGILAERLRCMAQNGVPNYFGPQRFGRDAGNLSLALRPGGWRRLPRAQRSFALSALRGALFNLYVAERVRGGSWLTGLEGDAQQSDRARGAAEQDTSVFEPRLAPAGPLWGRGNGGASGAARELEERVYGAFPAITGLLEQAGARFSRRPLIARLGELDWDHTGDQLRLQFALGPGAFATTVLHAALTARDAATIEDDSADA
jgi:tRNA pseudouridine13 synthase